MARPERPTVAVIGAGFSGLLTALHLLEQADGPVVRLVERRSAFGRGAAYSTTSDEHLLNVRAANMSAFPDRPSHFTDWLAAEGGATAGAAFVTRARYGAYLQTMLRRAADGARGGRLVLEADEAVRLAPEGGGFRIGLGMGRGFRADAAVLAIGNLPPHLPPGVGPAAAESPAYFGDPWSADFATLPETGCGVLIGTGLTMVDLALRLTGERPGLKLLGLSRRGLLPRRHLPLGPAAEVFTPQQPETPRALLGELRRRARGADWRAVVDGLRPHVQAVWRGWPLAERRRFLRHLRPWWDIHRHRLAPDVAAKLDHLTGCGSLSVAAGRLLAVEPEGEALRVAWAPRATRETKTIRAAAVINCIGPNGDLTRAGDTLLGGLAEAGLIRADACRLGLDVDVDGRALGRDGRPHPRLFAVGPTTRGAFWEITSVPDIRVQASLCAGAVAGALVPA